MASAVRITVGMMSFEGIDSSRVPLVASQFNPNGLPIGKLPWANNVSFRGGAMQPRPGYVYLGSLPVVALFQDAYLYEPTGEFPYLISQIGGRTFKTILTETPLVTTEITIAGDPNPANLDQAWMQQGEEFLFINDGQSLPLFFDGETMRRSSGNSLVLGVVQANFAVPAVGGSVLVTLTQPFQGQPNQVVLINGKKYIATATNNYVQIQTSATSFPGSLIKAGALFNTRPGGVLIGTTQADFVVPAAATPVTVPIQPAYTGAVPIDFSLVDTYGGYTNLNTWSIVAIGAAPPGANQVYLTNIDDTPGDTVTAGANLESVQELPPGQALDYYMGRMWVANGREYLAGDIVGGPSGSPEYGYRDSILKMTENAFTVSGGAFIVPSQGGNIRALKHPANLDTALGEGQLLPFTRRNIYSTNVTPTRAEWATLSEPIQRVAQINFGSVGDRCVVPVNGDLFYQSVDGVRSLQQAIRYFQQWGNVPLSQEEERAIEDNDRSLLRFATGVEYDNRLFQSVLPFQTPVGVAHPALMPLNFEVLNSMDNKLPPIWEGVWEGVNVLKLLRGDFGGRQRSFALVWSAIHQEIQIWEMTPDVERVQDYGKETTSGGDRIKWSAELPAFDWGNPFEMKQLDAFELWVDRLSGTVDFLLEFRPDQFPCWIYWNRWTECAPKNECELPNALQPCDHPTQEFPPQYRATMVSASPPTDCNTIMGRPMNKGYTFQFRLTIKGQCRVRGLLVHALPLEKQPYHGLVCPTTNALAETPIPPT